MKIKQCGREQLTLPKRVDSMHQLLVLSRNFLFNVLVKAWLYSQDLRQGRKIIDTIWKKKGEECRKVTLQLCLDRLMKRLILFYLTNLSFWNPNSFFEEEGKETGKKTNQHSHINITQLHFVSGTLTSETIWLCLTLKRIPSTTTLNCDTSTQQRAATVYEIAQQKEARSYLTLPLLLTDTDELDTDILLKPCKINL